ncbi:transglutaminase family protein [Streptomyces sp. NPDC127084]|uniref:transglutaminase-like domain-containing protein n=1 Tax=Streptomyces sp. NPDC127084 TaxID=3347133 RepID=UPI00365A5AF0
MEETETQFDELLKPTEFLDHQSPEVRSFVSGVLGEGHTALTPVERAVKLYYAVRDDLFYEVYGADMSRQGLRASSVVRRGSGFCVHKSILYAAAVRAAGIPSRLVYGSVRNHLASDRLKEFVGGDVFYHALTSVYLNGTWVKATPVFNRTLCLLYKIGPLEFDGLSDSLYHPHDLEGHAHMEFLEMHGEFDDFPYDTVMSALRTKHPRMFETPEKVQAGSLVAEATAS